MYEFCLNDTEITKKWLKGLLSVTGIRDVNKPKHTDQCIQKEIVFPDEIKSKQHSMKSNFPNLVAVIQLLMIK